MPVIATADAVLARVPGLRQLRAEHYAQHFDDFCQAAWSAVFPGDKLCWSPALDYLCEVLTAVKARDPRYLRVLWNMPVRSGKSYIASVAFPCWVFLTDPAHQFVCASYSMDLGILHNLARRNLILSPWYQKLFSGRFRLSEDRNTTAHFSTDRGGSCFVASVGSRLLGFGFSTAICDDIMDNEIALSDAARSSAHAWFDSTLRTRANDPSTAAIFSVSQRLHEDDTTGHLLASEPGVWTHVAIPLLAEEATEYTFPSGRVWRRPAGDILQPRRFPVKVIEELQAKRLRWASMYQQSPLCLDGNMVRDSDLRYCGGTDRHTGQPDEPLPSKFDYTLIGVDCAFKSYSTSDFTAIITVGIKGTRRYVLDVVNRHLDVGGMEAAIREQRDRWGPIQAVIIESAASGIAVAERLRVNVGGVIEVTPQGGKIARFASVCPEFQAGAWFLSRNASWSEPLRFQLLAFPQAKNDDMVDAIAYIGTWAASHTHYGDPPPILKLEQEFSPELTRALAHGDQPAQWSHVSPAVGRKITDGRGLADMTPAEVDQFLFEGE